jgi:GDP-D-mannose dehydratase
MNSPIFRSDDAPWKGSYIAALFQDDTTKVPALIARAESQITERARMLYEAPIDNASELRALNNALRMLQVLKTCVKRATSEKIIPVRIESDSPQIARLSAY